MNICMCGEMAGYPHKVYCPYPLYNGSERDEDKWHAAKSRSQNLRLLQIANNAPLVTKCVDCGKWEDSNRAAMHHKEPHCADCAAIEAKYNPEDV